MDCTHIDPDLLLNNVFGALYANTSVTVLYCSYRWSHYNIVSACNDVSLTCILYVFPGDPFPISVSREPADCF